MANAYLLKKTLLCMLLVSLFFIFSCSVGAKKNINPEKHIQDIDKMEFQTPLLRQQKITDEDSGSLEEYSLYNSIVEDGPLIPGIFQTAVPQGMAYYASEDLMLISNYMFDGRPSCITIVSMTDSNLIKTIWLLSPDGSPFKGHVGGLAVSDKLLWIASGKGVYYVSLDTLAEHNNNSNITMTAFVPTFVSGSYATFLDGVLWVGEFTSRDRTYSTPDSHHYKTRDGNVNHGLMVGFSLDSESGMIKPNYKIDGISYPDYIISMPDEVQGAAFIQDKVILSQSYGRGNNSRISVYYNPFGNLQHGVFLINDGSSIPVWILDERNFKTEIIAPPMTEGLVNYMDFAAILFESGSDKYIRTAKNPQDRIVLLKIKKK